MIWFSLKVNVKGGLRKWTKRYLTFKVIYLLQVLEIRPSIKWDKGKALEFLLESLGEFQFNT